MFVLVFQIFIALVSIAGRFREEGLPFTRRGQIPVALVSQGAESIVTLRYVGHYFTPSGFASISGQSEISVGFADFSMFVSTEQAEYLNT